MYSEAEQEYAKRQCERSPDADAATLDREVDRLG
jgi:hypothetical protein